VQHNFYKWFSLQESPLEVYMVTADYYYPDWRRCVGYYDLSPNASLPISVCPMQVCLICQPNLTTLGELALGDLGLLANLHWAKDPRPALLNYLQFRFVKLGFSSQSGAYALSGRMGCRGTLPWQLAGDQGFMGSNPYPPGHPWPPFVTKLKTMISSQKKTSYAIDKPGVTAQNPHLVVFKRPEWS